MNILHWLQDNRGTLIATTLVLAVLVVALRLYGAIRRRIRDRQPVKLNPKLQKYAGRSQPDPEVDRLASAKVIATSSTGQIAGYEVTRQVEAVFAEGCRSPEEAIVAIKTAAGRLGANAVINLAQRPAAAGLCALQGDAVVVHLKPDKPQAEQRG